MKNEVIGKINQLGKIGEIITRIAKILLTLAFVICLVSAVFLFALPDDTITIKMSHQALVDLKINDMVVLDDDVESSLEINGVKYEIVDYIEDGENVSVYSESEDHVFNLSKIWWLMIPAMLTIAAMYVVTCFLEKLCKEFRVCETPFTDRIVKLLGQIAKAIIPMAFLAPLTESVLDSVFTGNVHIRVGVDLTVVLLVILIFILAAIFKYGTMLQIESDETL